MVEPFISVVIPTYNRKALLKECLESLFAQTYPKEKYEIVVVDDGSTDGTEELLKDIRASHDNFRYFRQERMGMFPAWNAAASHANGKILVMTDNDCIAPDKFLESVAGCFEKHPEIAACAGEAIPIFKDRLFAPLSGYFNSRYGKGRAKDIVFSCLNPTVAFWSSNAAVRKEVFWSFGGFDRKFAMAGPADADLGFKILAAGQKIYYAGNIHVHHYQRDSLNKLLIRHFRFGLVESINIKDHFNNWVALFLPFGKCICRPGAPFTLFLRFDTFEIVSFLIILSFLLPVAGIVLFFLYFLRGYMTAKGSGCSLPTYLLYKLYHYLICASSFFGHIVGSIKNGVIYL